MTQDRIFVVNIKQLKSVFDAGRSRGEETATFYEWGRRPIDWDYQNLADIISEIINENKQWNDADYTKQEEIEQWIRKSE